MCALPFIHFPVPQPHDLSFKSETKPLKTSVVAIRGQCTGHGFKNQDEIAGFADPNISRKVSRKHLANDSKGVKEILGN